MTAAVILVPLIIAIVVTGWSLEQARYRPKRRKPAQTKPEEREREHLPGGDGPP